MTPDSREPFWAGEAVDDCNGTKSNEVGQKGGFLCRDDDPGAVVPLEADDLENFFVQRLCSGYLEHVLISVSEKNRLGNIA